MTLTEREIEDFVRDVFIRLPGAMPRRTALRCQDELWRATGYDPQEPSTWVEPVVHIPNLSTPPFVEAATTGALHEAYDQLVGEEGGRR